MRLHLRFQNISENVLEAIRVLIADRPWDLGRDARCERVTEFFATMCAHAEVTPVPQVRFQRARHGIGGRRGFAYQPESTGSLGLEVTPAVITFNKWRAVQIIAAIRFHIDTKLGSDPGDPHPWACSAYYQANPVSYRATARKGMIRDVEIRDTFSTSTWNKFVDGGLVDRNGNLRFPAKDCLYFAVHGDFPEPVTEPVVGRAPSPGEAIAASVDLDLSDLDEAVDQAAIDTLESMASAQGAISGAAMASVEQDELDDEEYDEDDDEGEDEDVDVLDGNVHSAEEVQEQFSNEVATELEGLGIVKLRKISRGKVTGGYSMTTPVLIAAIRRSMTPAEITAKIVEVSA